MLARLPRFWEGWTLGPVCVVWCHWTYVWDCVLQIMVRSKQVTVAMRWSDKGAVVKEVMKAIPDAGGRRVTDVHDYTATAGVSFQFLQTLRA